MMSDRPSDRQTPGEPPTLDREWLERIAAEVDGRNPEAGLWWTLPGGVRVPAVQGPSDRPDPVQPVPMRPPGEAWDIRQDIVPRDEAALRASSASATGAGADVLGVVVGTGIHGSGWNPVDVDDLVILLPELPVVQHLVAGPHGPSLMDRMIARASVPRNGTLDLDPASVALTRGDVDEHGILSWAASAVRRLKETDSRFRPLSADGLTAHWAGASDVTESAVILASVSTWLASLATGSDIDPDRVARAMHVRTSAGPRFFPTLGRLRALRLGIAQVCRAYGVSEEVAFGIPIHVQTSPRHLAAFDANTNLVRATTAAAAAIAGGCHSLTVTPHDHALGTSARGYRLALAVQLMLRDEGHVHRVVDPGAGSWYIESLTERLGVAAWELFREIERRGGSIEAVRSGFLPDRIRHEARDEERALDTRTGIMVGVNRYPDPAESRPDVRPVIPPEPGRTDDPFVPEDAPGPGVDFRRPSSRLESLRAALRSANGHEHAPALLVTFGERSVCGARSDFAAEFLGCAGIRTEGPTWCASPSDLGRMVLESDSPIVVLCGSDDAFPEYGSAARDMMGRRIPDFTLVGVGRPPDDLPSAWSVDACIHRDTPLLSGLVEILSAAGLRFEDEGP